MGKLPGCLMLAAAAALLCAAPAAAQPAEEFYKGRTMRMLIGYGPGTGNDLYGRVLATHMAKHIPGRPIMVPQNMPGAAGLTMTNALYNTVPKDGTVIGMPSRQHITEPLFGNEQARFDVLKFTWIGNMSRDTALCFTWHTSGIATMDDAKKREVLVGSTGQASPSYSFPRLLNSFLGTRFKPLLGYPDSGAIGIAMEQGELDGYCSFTLAAIRSARPQWLLDKQVNVLAQMTLRKHPDLPDAPLIMDMAPDATARQAFTLVFADQEAGRPVAAPPDIAPDRAATLRAAFAATMRDPDFLEEARRTGVEIDGPTDGAALLAVIRDIYATPKAVVARVAAMRNGEPETK